MVDFFKEKLQNVPVFLKSVCGQTSIEHLS